MIISEIIHLPFCGCLPSHNSVLCRDTALLSPFCNTCWKPRKSLGAEVPTLSCHALRGAGTWSCYGVGQARGPQGAEVAPLES